MKRIIFLLTFVIVLGSNVHANHITIDVDEYIKQFNSIAENYTFGIISKEDAACKWIEVEFLFRHASLSQDKRLQNIERGSPSTIVSELIIYFNEKYENNIDQEQIELEFRNALRGAYEKIPETSPPVEESVNQILESTYDFLKHLLTTEDTIVTYYSLNKERPIVVYLTFYSYGLSGLFVKTFPELPGLPVTADPSRIDELDRIYDMCTKAVMRPFVMHTIDSAQLAIAEAKNAGIDTTKAENYIKKSISFFEEGNYRESWAEAEQAKDSVTYGRELDTYIKMSESEKKEYILRQIEQVEPPKDYPEVEMMSEVEEEKMKKLGVKNFQVAYTLGKETIFSTTFVMNYENKTKTVYENKLYGKPDLYVAMDIGFLYEMSLISKTEADLFKIGVRIGKALFKGEVRVVPFWKIYKVLSITETLGEGGTEFTRGVISSIS